MFNLPIRSQIMVGMLAVFLTTVITGVVAYRAVNTMASTSESLYSSVAVPLIEYDATGEAANTESLLGKVDLTSAEALIAENREYAEKSMILLAGIAGGGLLLAILLGVVIAGAIRSPVIELKEVAEKISQGDEQSEVGFAGNNELSEMAKSFNKMVHHLRENMSLRAVQSQQVDTSHDSGAQFKQQLEDYKRQLESDLQQMVEAMHKLADGDLTTKLQATSNEASTELYKAFNQVVSRMGAIMADMQGAIGSTASVAQAIKNRSNSLSKSSSQISGQTTDVAAATEEMATSIVDNARNASATAEVSENIGEVAKRGKGVVEQTITKINEIASAVEESSKVVQLLSKSSEQIGDIVLVIDEIADQTNLLALNAAIEAARAGELGKGFAVVADEVRKLAERTSVATQEISGKIKRVQSDTVNAVKAMNTGTEKVKEGIGLAQEAGGALDEVVKSAANGADMVLQIAAAVEEQSATSSSISQSIEMVSEAVHDSGRNIAAINEEVENLVRSATGVQQLLGDFRLPASQTQVLQEA